MTGHPHDGSGEESAGPGSGGNEQEAMQARVEELEQEASTLRMGMDSRQQIGFATGVLGQRYGLDPDQAWTLLARVSQDLNIKARRVAEVISDVYRGQLDPVDAALAGGIARLLPDSSTLSSDSSASQLGAAEASSTASTDPSAASPDSGA